MFEIRQQLETIGINSRRFPNDDLLSQSLRPRSSSRCELIHNGTVAELYEAGLRYESAGLTENGALAVSSGACQSRRPGDRRIVENPESQHEISWGESNYPLRPMSYRMNRRRAVDFLNSQSRLYVVDGFTGGPDGERFKVRLIASRAHHALCMRNLLTLPSDQQLASFGTPDFTILNAGGFPADPLTPDVTSPVSTNINFEAREMVILGTEYAGEMRQGIFSVLNYWLPPRGVLTMQCAANEGLDGDVTLFVGHPGTGKTSLAIDPNRRLIADDQLGWSDRGVFNLEGGLYADYTGLTSDSRTSLVDAIRFGSVLENCDTMVEASHVIGTEACSKLNARACLRMDSLPGPKAATVAGHPKNILFLTCDTYGVLPLVGRLTPEQAHTQFLNGYTGRLPGTENGISEPQPIFSPCYGAPFITRRPCVYAEMLVDRIREYQPNLWLINTGWTGGRHQEGHRISLSETRAIIDAIHGNRLQKASFMVEPVFGLEVPTQCPGIDADRLIPGQTWSNAEAYMKAANLVRDRFLQNFNRLEFAPIQLAGHAAGYHRTGI